MNISKYLLLLYENNNNKKKTDKTKRNIRLQPTIFKKWSLLDRHNSRAIPGDFIVLYIAIFSMNATSEIVARTLTGLKYFSHYWSWKPSKSIIKDRGINLYTWKFNKFSGFPYQYLLSDVSVYRPLWNKE